MSGAEQQTAEKRPLERSPSFPYIGLTKAVERTEQLFGYAKRHEIRILDAAKPVWDMGPKSSATQQTVAALLAFGLIEGAGSGDGRKIKLSELGFLAVADPRPGVKEATLRDLAVKPKIVAELAERWGAERPADVIALAELTVDRNFTQEGARAFLRVYDDTMRYVADNDDDSAADKSVQSGSATAPRDAGVSVGDSVRVEHGGQIIFEAAKVRALHDHGGQTWAYLDEADSAVAVSDLTLLKKASEAPSTPPPPLPLPRHPDFGTETAEGLDRFTIDEGVVRISFPKEMTAGSIDDLEAFFALFIKKAKRRAGVG